MTLTITPQPAQPPAPALNDTQAPTVTDFLLRLLCLPSPDWGLGWRQGDRGDQVQSTHNTQQHSQFTLLPLLLLYNYYHYSAVSHSGGQLQVRVSPDSRSQTQASAGGSGGNRSMSSVNSDHTTLDTPQ